MATYATALVLNPTVTRTLKLWGTTVGRDKTYRFVQYFSRFVAYHLIARDIKEWGVRLNALKSALGSGRKMMRLFKPLEHLQSAVKTASQTEYPLEQFTQIGRQIGYFGYLSLDMIVWLNSIKFINLEKEQAKRIAQNSQRFWLSGIALSILCGLLKVTRTESQIKKLNNGTNEKPVADETDRKLQIKTIQKARFTAQYQLLQDSLDIWLPLSSLDYVKLSDGTLGLVGTVTSFMALRTNWAKTA